MQGFMVLVSIGTQNDILVFCSSEILTKSMKRKM